MCAQTANVTPIKDLKPGLHNLCLHFIVLDIGRPTTVKDNQEVRTVKVADRTGMVNLSLWNEPGKVLQSGDIVRVTRAYTGMFKTCLTVYTNRVGEFSKIGEFCMLFNEMPNMSEPNPELAAQFEKEDAERKAARANRDSQMGTAGKTGGTAQTASAVRLAGSGGGSGLSKTWGTQVVGAQNSARKPHRPRVQNSLRRRLRNKYPQAISLSRQLRDRQGSGQGVGRGQQQGRASSKEKR